MIIFPSKEALVLCLTDLIEASLDQAIAQRGAACFAMSGGSTPTPLYQRLATRPVAWSKVTGLLVDERWVAPGQPGSNESMIAAALQHHEAATMPLRGLWADAPTPAQALDVVTKRHADISQPLDMVVLGMGEDGHTASWFPKAHGLDRALAQDGRLLAAIEAQESMVTGAFLHRMTLTLGAVATAKRVILMLTGDHKKAAYEKACADGPIEEMPVRAILRARPDMWVCWAA